MAQYTPQTEYTEYREEGISRLANPVPLGLLVLALITALVGASFAHFLVPATRLGLGTITAPVLIYGGGVLIIAGILAFRRNETLAPTVFVAYGAFCLAFGVLFLPLWDLIAFFGTDIPALNHALGLFFLCWMITAGVLMIGSLRTNPAMTVVLILLFLAYLFLAIGAFANANGPLLAIGGWLGIICALFAWYVALGSLLMATNSSLHLPLLSRRETLPPPTRYDREAAM